MTDTIKRIIEKLNLEPHPEGGYYRETYRCKHHTFVGDGDTIRNLSTAIYFLVPQGVQTNWHRVSSDEMWHYYAGAPLTLDMKEADGTEQTVTLGPLDDAAAEPQFLIPAHAWQRAATTGEYTLVGCTVSPGFDFEDFEMTEGDV